jgi:acyl transferase domain-containing protein
MAGALYDGDPGFRADLDECSAVLRSQLGLDLRDVLYPESGGEELAEQRLAQTAVTQPALFVIEYALAMAWLRLGVEPESMIGHSVGEYVAACLGGVFTRDDALRLVAERARLMQALPEGTMLAVRTTGDDVRELLPDDLEIAAENAPNLTVVSGETAAIERFEVRLAERDVAARRLATSHAFHSSMMEPILEEFAEVVASTPRSAPTLPWVSSLTGDWITHEQSQDSAYWVDQIRRPVLFAKGIARLLEEDPARVTLEVGPGRQLTGLTKQAFPDRPWRRHAQRRGRPVIVASPRAALDRRCLLDWSAFHTDSRRRRVPLPTYPFERKRHWVDRAAGEPVASGPDPAVNHDRYEDEMPVTSDPTDAPAATGRRDALVDRLRSLFSDLSGMDAASIDTGAAFLELGLDSLVLTQAALLLQKTFDVKISFRELLEELSTIDALAAHLDGVLPAEAAPVPATPPAATAMPAAAAATARPGASGGTVRS